MKYMALIYSSASSGDDPVPGTPEFDAYMAPWIALDQRLREDGVFVAGEALMPVETATSLRIRGGKTETMDGPFAETKEQLGGFYLVECEHLDQAIGYARILSSETASIEVRPVMFSVD